MRLNKSSIFVGLFALVLVLTQLSFAAATAYDNSAYEQSFPLGQVPSGSNPDVIVSVLKYEPYPVIAGEWFDLWVKVQNIGQESAKNLSISLIPEYPFSSDDNLTRNYGVLFGTQAGWKVDQTLDSTQVILKYHVKTAENAISGSSKLKISVIPDVSDSSSFAIEKDLPIEIFSSNNVPVATQTTPVNNSQSIYYGIIGLISGIFVVIIISLLRKKIQSRSK